MSEATILQGKAQAYGPYRILYGPYRQLRKPRLDLETETAVGPEKASLYFGISGIKRGILIENNHRWLSFGQGSYLERKAHFGEEEEEEKLDFDADSSEFSLFCHELLYLLCFL